MPSVTLDFVFARPLVPDILPHCPFVFLRSNVCLPPFRAASLRRRPGGSATVGVTSPRRERFIPIDHAPAGHTSAGLATPLGGKRLGPQTGPGESERAKAAQPQPGSQTVVREERSEPSVEGQPDVAGSVVCELRVRLVINPAAVEHIAALEAEVEVTIEAVLEATPQPPFPVVEHAAIQ